MALPGRPPGKPTDGGVEDPQGLRHALGADFPGGQLPPPAVGGELGLVGSGGGQQQRWARVVSGDFRLAAQRLQDRGGEAGNGLERPAQEGSLRLRIGEADRAHGRAEQDQRPRLAVGGEPGPRQQPLPGLGLLAGIEGHVGNVTRTRSPAPGDDADGPPWQRTAIPARSAA
jgi:hypothetical protein